MIDEKKVLSVNKISKKIGKNIILSECSLHVDQASIYGLVGKEGSGKTTLLKIICGLMEFDEGYIFIDDKNIINDYENIKELISYIPKNYGIYKGMSCFDYLQFFTDAYKIRGVDARKKIINLFDFLNCDIEYDTKMEMLTVLQIQKINMIRALLNEPMLIIIDEPDFLKNNQDKNEFKDIMDELVYRGTSILFTSEQLSDISDISSSIGIMDKGRVIIEGKYEKVMDNIQSSNPVIIEILDGVSTAMSIFRANKNVTSISINGKTFSIGFNGRRIEESMLLNELISNDVAVRSFVRENGDLESFLNKTQSSFNDKVLMKNDY